MKIIEFKNKKIEELFKQDGEFGGDKPNLASVSQIATDTQKSFDDFSDFEEGIPSDTDKVISLTKNKLSKTHPFGPNMGSYVHYYGAMYENNIRKLVRDYLIRNVDNEFVSKFDPLDINDNNILDIDEIDHTAVISKLNNFLDVLQSHELGKKEIGSILYYLLYKINDNVFNLKDLPYAIRHIIKKLF